MKCENCGHLILSYDCGLCCEIGIADNSIYDTGDGCNLTKKERVTLCKKLKKHKIALYWDESEASSP